MSESTDPTLPLGTRLWFAWVCLIRVLFDGLFAARAFRIHRGELELPPLEVPPQLPEKAKPAPKPEPEPEPEPKPALKAPPAAVEAPSTAPALQLLALLQREGRLIDFVQQDITSFSDADIGAAARVIHEGCRKALREHARIAPVRAEEEGAKITLNAGYSPAEIKLPVPVAGHDPHILAPAEVEL